MSKPWTDRLVVVTATADPIAAQTFLATWHRTASLQWVLVLVVNGQTTWHGFAADMGDFPVAMPYYTAEFLGSVPAFAKGIELVREHVPKAEVIACLHDDLEITEPGWDVAILDHFAQHPACGLAGFSGAEGLGSDDLYQTPYQPGQLARQGFMSNLRDAEAHGRRELRARRVACCDGFSLIGRAKWWLGDNNPWQFLCNKGVIHHAYDSWLGLLAAKSSWETWYLPIACHHAGGRTAVANQAYAVWADGLGGDHHFWEEAHRAFYEDGRGWLPIRVRG